MQDQAYITTAPQAELNSNIPEIINRLDNLLHQVRRINLRLERKNDQMISHPSKTGKELVREIGAVSPRLPLMSELNGAVVNLDVAITELQDTVSVTETI
jgi:hypothetical protein